MNTIESLENAFNTNELKEDQTNEFKTSIFVAPTQKFPGTKQMHEIADTLAAFMNADGGHLYIGVRDDLSISGIESDLVILSTQAKSVVAESPRGSDAGYTYGNTGDKYELKIRAIVKAYLSPNAKELLKRVGVIERDGHKVCRVECAPCRPDEVVYSYHPGTGHTDNNVERAEIFVRYGNQKIQLVGAARDEFIAKRVRAGFDAQMKVLASAVEKTGAAQMPADLSDAIHSLLSKMDDRRLVGPVVTVSGAQPFTEETVSAVKKPKSLAWDGTHYTDVDSWKTLILKMFEKAQELAPAKFDAVAASKLHRNFAVIEKAHEKHPDCFKTRFGANGAVLVKSSLGNKKFLWDPSSALLKIFKALEIDVSRFTFVAE